MGPVSQLITTTQFYLFGRSHFTATGWARASKKYVPAELEVSLAGKSYCVTGANSGVGRECARFLYSRGARVFCVCRNRERGERAVAEMSAEAPAVEGGRLELVVGDVSLASSTVEIAAEIERAAGRLAGLVCNAGALSATKTMTAEGVETTFAAHLAFGSYLLSRRLKADRIIFVTSGGMYNTKFPDVATCVDPPDFDGSFAYARAKRGQVLLAERLARDGLLAVSSHPGWTDTPGVESAYGAQKSWLQPLRSLWQGAEGMCWLCVADPSKLQPGALYLDRAPQRKHLAGPFFTEGSATKNTPLEVDTMLSDLQALCDKVLPSPSSSSSSS